MMKDKIAIVVQRYGIEINGGAELHARLLAEKLIHNYDVEILTTCAMEYQYWSNHYPEGTEIINNIKVRRFQTLKKDYSRFQSLSRYVYNSYKYEHRKITLLNYFYLKYKRQKYRKKPFNFNEWLNAQGPNSQNLVNFISKEKKNYDVFIFFTYMYHPTNIGIQEVNEKSILIPTAHDEPPFYLKGYARLFSSPKFIMYNMESEKKLVEKVYPSAKNIKSDIAGIGFDEISKKKIDIKIDKKYFIYIGRMEDSKGCNILLDFFNRFVDEFNPNIELIFIGQNVQDYTESRNVKFLGFVDEDTKNFYLENSEALIIPSLYESLSMVTLEAMRIGKPVIANSKCDVLKNHIEHSKAGFLFENYDDLKETLQKVLNLAPSDKEKIAENGINYVKSNYDWDVIVKKFDKAIEFINRSLNKI